MQFKYKAIIIDDEKNALIVLKLLLEKHCPQVLIVAEASNGIEAVSLINTYLPDIIFLDIEMPQMNGFQVLDQIKDLSLKIIFTTAYDQYAIKAFKYCAIDYLLKPISTSELIVAVDKIETSPNNQANQFTLLKETLNKSSKHLDRIALPHSKGFLIQLIDEIIYCESLNTYTKFYFTNKEPLLVTKPLGEIEEILDGCNFCRPHRQYVVNNKKVKEVIKTDGGYLIMYNNKQIPIARNKKQEVFNQFLLI